MELLEKKVLIISSDIDRSTSEVLEWLIVKKQPFIRLNDNVCFDLDNIEIMQKQNKLVLKYNGEIIYLKNIKSFWYRRGSISVRNNIPDSIPNAVKIYLNEECKAIEAFIIYELDKLAKINHYGNSNLNKLYQLSLAVECGLNIPYTAIANDSSTVKKILLEHKSIVSKSIQASLNYQTKSNMYSLMTSKFENCDLDTSAANFFYTKFQPQIVKDFELRIFFLNKKFYTMAIFSQRNKKTEVDFRNYDFENPNRCVPYKLPVFLEKKLLKLMNKLDLLSGSIDMIVRGKEYYFLEVNPVGQFGMVSYPCNYYLEEKIAEILSKNENKKLKN
ncbi:MAG: grasp-with-spasm system ATP-grasp peptide maturase [Bacteroidota bacterium]|nr:grasp-with-spasm system ATP-grasp peptide maturase [Bacteroidota bacterium]